MELINRVKKPCGSLLGGAIREIHDGDSLGGRVCVWEPVELRLRLYAMRTSWIAGGLLLAVCLAGCGDDLPIAEGPQQAESAAQEPQTEPVPGSSATQETTQLQTETRTTVIQTSAQERQSDAQAAEEAEPARQSTSREGDADDNDGSDEVSQSATEELTVTDVPTMTLAEAVGRPPIATRPGGEFAAHRLAGSSHPILGRSVDGQWIALRVDALHPEYVWTWTDTVALNRDISELPIYVGEWMQTMSIDNAGWVGEPSTTIAPLYHWQWRADGTIVGSRAGLWHWHPASGELRRFADAQWVKFSPDGRYAASGCCQDYQAGDLMRDVTIMPVDGREPIVFTNANSWHFTHQSEDPTLRWSPDSTHVLSAIRADGSSQFEPRYAILGIDGSRTDVPWRERFGWLPDGTLYDAGGDLIRVYEADGSLIREIPFRGRPIMRIGVSDDLLAVGQAANPRDGYWLIDLNSGEQTKLPSPFDLAPRNRGGSGWRPLVFAGGSLYFFRTTLGGGQVPGGGLLYRYDIDSGAAVKVDDTLGYDFGDWPRVAEQCPRECERFALATDPGRLIIIDPARDQAVSVPLPAGARRVHVVDWSPDGAQLLVRLLRETAEYDEAGFATHSENWEHDWEFAVSEYLIIRAADGSILQRFRAPVDECWTAGHTGAWSPDGRWLAFGGDYVDCT